MKNWILITLSFFSFAARPIEPSFSKNGCGGLLVLGSSRLGEAPQTSLIKDIVQALSNHSSISSILSGAQPLTWRQFQEVKDLHQNLESILNKAPNMTLETDLNHSSEALRLRAEYIDASQKASAENFGPTGHGLLRSYRETLTSLPQPLADFFFSNLAPLPADSKREQLYDLARAQVKRLEKLMVDRLHTTGYSSMDELRSAAQNAQGTKVIREGKYEFAMLRPRSGRWWIERVGFHNQYVTGSSNGLLDPKRRLTVEMNRMQLDEDDYSKFDLNLRPKYGILLPALEFIQKHDNWSYRFYGEDFYIFKKSKVRDRLTLTLGDSLNGYIRAFPLKGDWNELFIPHHFLELIGPFIQSEENLIPSDEASIAMKLNRSLSDRYYIELQLFGPVDLDDVEAFIFTGDNPPTGSFLKALKERNIKIYHSSSDGLKVFAN